MSRPLPLGANYLPCVFEYHSRQSVIDFAGMIQMVCRAVLFVRCPHSTPTALQGAFEPRSSGTTSGTSTPGGT
jgi:hypothetical protein